MSAASLNVVRLSIAAVLTAGALMVGLLSGPATATANPPGTGVNSCSNGIAIACWGQDSGNPITVEIGNVSVLSGNAVKVELEKVLNDNVHIGNVQLRIDHIASDLVLKLKALNVLICQVKVLEIGLVNLNIAKC
jgi:hypothetical protein